MTTFYIYLRLVFLHLLAQAQYRLSFAVDLLGVVLLNAMWFLSFALVLQRFNGIAGWSLSEIAFLYGVVEMAFGTADMVFAGFDPDDFGLQVQRGTFDQLLLRPVNVAVQVLASRIVLQRFGRVIQGGVVFTFAIVTAHMHWTLLKLVYLPLVFCGLVCFFGGIFILGSTITFWTVQSVEATNVFTLGGSEMMSYPMSIYPEWMRRVFTFIVPAIFLNYYPALYMLDKPDPLHLPSFSAALSPVCGAAVLIVALLFWRIGLRNYQSTGM